MKTTFSIALASLALAACGNDAAKTDATAKPEARAGATAGGAVTMPASTSGGASGDAKPAVAGAPQGYSLDGIKTIADGCASAGVIVTSAPKSVGASYTWPFTRMAAYANRQFKYGASGAGGVTFEQIEDDASGSFTLIAKCGDGATCNQFAAMYKAIVRSSKPQPFCGPTPVKGAARPAAVVPADGAWTPQTVIEKCARLGACLIATDRATPGDPALECQKSPGKFKTECATRESCAEVLACSNK